MMYQWQIFLATLDPTVGSEQAGRRPVLVVSREPINEILPVVNVVPLTSRKSPDRVIYPNEVLIPAGEGVIVELIALCYQIRTLDKRRLTQHLGSLANPILQEDIVVSLRFQLDL